MWCIQAFTPQYRERMYRLLALYQEPYDPRQPLVCMDEKSKQLLGDSRPSLKAKPGRGERVDYEYKRKGTCNVFVAVAPAAGKRVVKVTERRTKQEFAYFMEELVDKHFRKAKFIQVVLDNLNTHFAGSLTETFRKNKAARLLKKIRFIYTPKHGSWLNMAEIEINVMDRQCTGGRVASKEQLEEEAIVWAQERNDEHKKIEWTFTRKDADKKLSKHYVA